MQAATTETTPIETTPATVRPHEGEAMSRARESLGDVRSATRDLIHHGAKAVREEAGKLESRVREGAGMIESRVRDGAGSLEETASRMADRTATYVQEQPLKSLAFAAGTGALIAILAGMATRR
ncbi:MAG: DUF883 family protein [Rhodocyclaceae bacterium]|nr:DUF883 family protein [Rhodocyclaceae bacterium]